MCKYCATDNYRKIYANHYGTIPHDDSGRKYDIHHIDGNHSNNDPSNLKAVPLQEHYDIHYSQGDYGACRAIAMRLKFTAEQISELAKLAAKKRVESGEHPFLRPGFSREVQLKRVKEGTHHMMGGELQRKLVAEGKNPFGDPEFNRKHQKARVEAGTHNMLGASNPVHQKVADGTHNWQDREAAKARSQKLKAEGRHPLLVNNPNNVKLTCPHCNKTGSKPGMLRYHFQNCKLSKDNP